MLQRKQKPVLDLGTGMKVFLFLEKDQAIGSPQ
jgi:hypothetical protein